MRQALPLPDALVTELFALWDSVFGAGPHDLPPEVYRGSEDQHCRSVLFSAEAAGDVVSTCFTMHSRRFPIAGFADVATRPDQRGRGLATALCSEAVEDFLAHEGEAFFLGTGNPAAARVYHRLGWRKIVGNNVMVYVTSGRSPEEYLVDYFRAPGEVNVHAGGPDVRLSMIPLMATPHDWRILDANVGSRSCRYFQQNSCMGLYPRYTRGTEGVGAFYAASTADGRLVGLSSSVDRENGVRMVDGFVHKNFADALTELMEVACESDGGGKQVRARVAVEDEEKREALASIGFTEQGSGEPFDFDNREVASWTMARA